MAEFPHLALCMIVRDAEKTLPALLEDILTPNLDGRLQFDEFVFVDTGSKDATCALIEKAFTGGPLDGSKGSAFVPTFPALVPEQRFSSSYELLVRGQRVRVTLATMEWIHDFGAARQRSFELATAKWRMWLDADDRFLDQTASLRKMLENTERDFPKNNLVIMPYLYNPTTLQHMRRMVRWDDGFRWEGRLHEQLMIDQPVFISQWDSYVVTHQPVGGHERDVAVYARNRRICHLALNDALAEGDAEKAGRYAYYLGQAEVLLGNLDAAVELLRHSAMNQWSNLAHLGLVIASQIRHSQKRYEEAMLLAGEAMARFPEMKEGLGQLACVCFDHGNVARAAALFDRYFAQAELPIFGDRDIVFMDGVIPCYAALAYLAVGRVDDALTKINAVPEHVRFDERVRPLLLKANGEAMKRKGLAFFQQLWAFLVWNDEPLKAQALLKIAVPAPNIGTPEIGALEVMTARRMRHMKSWKNYKACYGEIFDDGATVEQVRVLTRAKRTREFAAALPKEGPPFYWLSVGPNDCIIEDDILAANPRIHMTVADASECSSPSMEKLLAKYPGRVAVHRVIQHHYDWPTRWDNSSSGFDAICMFEVLEHLPSDAEALRQLRNRLSDEGTLFLSTPVSSQWVNSSLTDAKIRYDWWGHVRSNSPQTLWPTLRAASLDGEVELSEGGAIFMMTLHKSHRVHQPMLGRVAILVPSTPQPFDVHTPELQHLGGSEEAVIHLAKELAALGYQMTVYTPRPDRLGCITVAKEGVLYRPVEEFNPHDDSRLALIIWRAPNLLLDPAIKAATYQKILWLHDTHYNAPVAAYKAADAVVVLSEAHVKALIAGDFRGEKWEGLADSDDTNITRSQNGIDVKAIRQALKEVTTRDPAQVIYASSPDRGLYNLLSIWRMVDAAVPSASLHIYYDWKMFDEKQPEQAEMLRDLITGLQNEDCNVYLHGGVSHTELHKAYAGAGVWAYPCNEFIEISCISAMKAQALGAWPVVCEVGALVETVQFGRTVPGWVEGAGCGNTHAEVKHLEGCCCAGAASDDALALFGSALVAALQQPPGDEQRKEMMSWAQDIFDWKRAAQQFYIIIRYGAEKGTPMTLRQFTEGVVEAGNEVSHEAGHSNDDGK